MPFHADAVTLTLAALLAALVVGILASVVSARARASRSRRDIDAISATLIDYFRRSGVAVSADCTRLANGRYIAMVESEPMKRFRLSHIIEMTLREHVRKQCGAELDKIYWRFPIKEAAQAAQSAPAMSKPDAVAPAQPQPAREQDAAKPAQEESDDYINEGLEHYRHIPKPEVTEVPWESFEQVSTVGRDKPEGNKPRAGA